MSEVRKSFRAEAVQAAMRNHDEQGHASAIFVRKT
jgi:hypothetical protein